MLIKLRVKCFLIAMLMVCCVCKSTAFAENDSIMTPDEYLMAFEEILAERDRASILGNTTKETKMNQLLEEMGAVEMTGEEVEALISSAEGVSPCLSIPREGKFKWTSTRVTTHYQGQPCEVMMVYISPIAEIDSVLINQRVLAEGGGALEYYTDERMAVDALNVLAFSLDAFESIVSLKTGMKFTDALFTLGDFLVNLAIDSGPDSAPAGTTFTYQIVNYTYMKWALVKPLTTSDNSQVIQLMASKTETHISFDMQMRYTNELGRPDVMNKDDDFIVVHSGNYYYYSISDVAKDYCQGAAMKKSYVGYLPIWVGDNDSDESHEKFLISIDTYAPNSYAQVFNDNELEE